MLQKFCLFFVLISLLGLSLPMQTFAIENPLARPNNKIGIHILFTTEIPQAAKLINSNGGDWGYVTIPLQSNDRDLKKWQQFMAQCRKYHIIPIVRLATEGDYLNTTVWRKPQLADVVDAAKFLDSLSWPTKNRYVIIYNEVNRGDEWGGAVEPSEYASLLSFAVTVFKSKNPDYFIISAGLDNAAPNQAKLYMNQYEYLRQMNRAVPGIFNQIDGLASHSYPNPGFSQPPIKESSTGVNSFKYERALAKQLNGKELPVFITETGWTSDIISDEKKTQYYQETFNTIWNDPGIVAITPFILEARGGAFQQFSFMTATGSATKQYQLVKDLLKTKGIPVMPVRVLAAEIVKKRPNNTVAEKETGFSVKNMIQKILSSLRGTE
jgi:hypothetical protein